MLNKKGFTMIEVLIAIFIVSIGVVGSYIILQRIFAATFISSSRLTAAYLAKEGFEIVRNIRDSNWIAGNNWNEGLDICTSSRFCEADYTDTSLTSISTTNPPNFLKVNEMYGYGVGDETMFSRKIEIKQSGPNSLEVIITVSWNEQGNDHSLAVEGFLYDWK